MDKNVAGYAIGTRPQGTVTKRRPPLVIPRWRLWLLALLITFVAFAAGFFVCWATIERDPLQRGVLCTYGPAEDDCRPVFNDGRWYVVPNTGH